MMMINDYLSFTSPSLVPIFWSSPGTSKKRISFDTSIALMMMKKSEDMDKAEESEGPSVSKWVHQG